MLVTAVASLSLITASGLLIDGHRRVWHRISNDQRATALQTHFARAQYRRRMRASSMIGVVGALIAIRPLVPHHFVWLASYLAILLLAAIYIASIGIIDAWASSMRFRQLRAHQLTTQARLALELRETRARNEKRKQATQPPSQHEDR